MLFHHGSVKLMMLAEGKSVQFYGFTNLIWLGAIAFIETVCALLIVVGLFTRWAAIPLIFTMLLAIFYAGEQNSFQRMEMALFYFAAFSGIGLAGAGWYSLDARVRKL